MLLAGGLIHRSAVLAERADQRAMVTAVHDYVLTSEPDFAPGLGSIDAMRLEPEHYRACVYGPEKTPDLPVRQHRPVARPASGATRPATRTPPSAAD